MTRFNITLEESVKFVLLALQKSIGQEMFVPKLPSYNIMDLAKATSSNSKKNIIGIREGEKIHEEMITYEDSKNAIETKNFYIILPSHAKIKKYLKHYKAKKISKLFSYNSYDTNKD